MTDPQKMIGESVIVTPKFNDSFRFEFEGTIVGYKGNENLYIVEDQDGDCFDVEASQIRLSEDEEQDLEAREHKDKKRCAD